MHLELPPDLVTLLTGLQSSIKEIDAKLTAVQAELRAEPPVTADSREWYSVDEVAKLLGKSRYTVREWCRHGQINAVKRAERRGCSALWSISAKEIARYRNEGLLGINPERNNVN
jgi:excisionase family DNA binding protein